MPDTTSPFRPADDSSGARAGSGPRPRWRALMMLVACLVLAGALSSCGQEEPSGAAPLGERAENDVPLNPPTLKFHVSADGEVGASPDLEAEAGEAVAMVLENETESGYVLRLLDPDGNDVFTVETPPGEGGDGRAMPRTVGTYVAEVYPTGARDAAEQFTVEVSEN